MAIIGRMKPLTPTPKPAKIPNMTGTLYVLRMEIFTNEYVFGVEADGTVRMSSGVRWAQKFPSKQEAVAYAQKYGIDGIVEEFNP